MSDIIDVQTNDQKAEDLKAIGWVSYVLHLIVALGAVIPGAQPGAALLIVALVIDLVKKGDAEGTWQANHFSWRIRTVIWAGVLYIVAAPLWLLFFRRRRLSTIIGCSHFSTIASSSSTFKKRG